MTRILGIDASTYQGTRGMSFARFAALDDAGARFGLFRASCGTAPDHSVAPNLDRAHARGWITGTYHFLLPGGAAAQADVYAKRSGTNLCVLDVEQAGIRRADVVAFVERFRELRPDRVLLAYTSAYKWRALTGNMDGPALFDGLWNALWTERGTDAVSDLPAEAPLARYGGWRTADIWQYGAFRVKGYPAIDGNAYYGTLDELRGLGKPEPPIPLVERPRYRRAYNEQLDQAVRCVSMGTTPPGTGPTWQAGIEAARKDAQEALAGLRLDEPA
jgi:hypothetical protein